MPGGQAVYVLGENTIRGVYVRNAKIVRVLGSRHGLRLEKSVESSSSFESKIFAAAYEWGADEWTQE